MRTPGMYTVDVDWINAKLTVERGIVCQQVDDVKTADSCKKLAIKLRTAGIPQDLQPSNSVLRC